MHRLDFVLVFLLSAAFLLKGADATRTKDRIYANIEGTSACFRRMNGTHQFGCASQRTGNVGVLQVLNNQADVAWLVKEAPEDKYMAVVFSDMFTRQTLDALKESPKVNGVVLLRSDLEESSLASYSPEDQCPNRYSGLSSFSEQQCGQKGSWNPKGNSLLLIDWGFPIFFVHNDTSIKKITDCFTKHNSVREGMTGRSLCAMEMQAFMIAAKDSETCIRRSNMINNLNPMRYCDPMGDRNVWATLFPREASEPDRSVIILAARLDTTSMFDGESPGAVSTVAGLVAALAAYDLLARTDLQEADGNVMLMLFNGEAYDYIGSSRLLYDINNKMFPKKSANVPSMGTDKIRMVIELNQLSQINRTAGGKVAPMFFHKTAGNDINNDVATFINAMKKLQSTIPVSFLDSSASSLPPVSLQSFVKADSKLPGVAITDYDQSFTNNFYHSILDDSKLLGFSYLNGTTAAPDSIQTFLADLSTALGWSIYELMAKKPYSGTARVNSSMVDEMLHCYLNSINCTLMRQATNDDYTLFEYPPALYVGVTNGPNAATGLTGRLVALLTGKEVNVTKDKCKINETDLTHQYLWMRGNDDSSKGVCVQTTMNYSAASSPAFDIEGYDWKSGQFSTWTESVWKSFEVRIFLKPSYGHEAFVISFGSVFLLLSFIVVYFIYIQSDVFFDPNINNGGC